ncbi:MAG: C-GCAxxG-C-C family (seleno)protein [Halanaerobiales bacterium]
MSDDKKLITRREALKKIGGVTAGSLLGGMALFNSTGLKSGNSKVLASSGTDEFPWPYTEVDPERVRKLGHEGHYLGNCGSGAFYGVLAALEERVGEPFSSFQINPPNMLHFGGGGMAGAGLTCGTLIGASAAVNLVAEPDKANEIVSELISWYKETPFPSDESNEYAQNHEFLVDDYHSDEELATTVADSALCQDSIMAWLDESGASHGSDEQLERCARLTGDVAAKAVELLNS